MVSMVEFRKNIKHWVNYARYCKERVIIFNYDKPVAAIVPIEDLEKIDGEKPIA